MTANVALAPARRSLGIAVVGVSLLRIRLRIARAGARHSAERGRSLACTVSAAPRAVIGRLLDVEYVPMLTEPLPMRLPVVIRPCPFILRAGAQGGRGIERDAPQRDGIPCFRHP